MGYPDYKTKQAVDMANQFADVAFDHLAKLGVGPKDLAPEKLKQMVSKQSQSQEASGAARAFIARALRGQNRGLQRRSARIAHKMLVAFGKAFPELNQQIIGDVVADLDSLWDTGQKLDKRLHKLFKMRFPQDRDHLSDFLAFIEGAQIEMAEIWIRNLRRNIPKLRKALNRQGKRQVRRTRAKAH